MLQRRESWLLPRGMTDGTERGTIVHRSQHD